MPSSNHSATDRSDFQFWGPCGGISGKKGNWSGLNIVAMVLGFVFFWPIGLFLVYWILTGRNVQELPPAIRHQWLRMKGKKMSTLGCTGESDNIVFNEYQNTQYDRIREIKEEIGERSRRFNEFCESAQRRADEDEFNRFMSSAPLRSE